MQPRQEEQKAIKGLTRDDKEEQDLSEHDTRQENQTTIERDIAKIFQELDFLKKRLVNVENVAGPHAPVKPLPEL
jgi:hypothetical protein